VGQKQEIDRQAEDAKRLKDKILKDRESGEGTPEEMQQRLSGYEKEFQEKVEARASQPVTDYGSADYMAELGDEYTLSTVPAFTRAAQGSDQSKSPAACLGPDSVPLPRLYPFTK
jgi:hypothetical protein